MGLKSRRFRIFRITAAAAVLALGFYLIPRGPRQEPETPDMRDSVNDHEGLAMSAGHAGLMGGGAEGCVVCHIAHKPAGARPLWLKEGAPDPAAFGRDSDQASGTKTGLCLSCHDGVVAKALSAHSLPVSAEHPRLPGVGSSHPVGIDYMASVRRAPESFLDPAQNPAIILEDGKVGCVSCHATHDAAVISAGSVRREVCVECHRR